ncbi:MAG: DUF2752 domain-containing protein [Planctomycetes bacterium]|nr:DUF2752 domain-containing protein [Planctomycetota bacterium]
MNPTQGKKPGGRTRGRLWAFLGLTAAFAFAMFWRPKDNGLPLCFFKWHTGLACPGCGMTRAVAALGHGDFAAAWKYHAFAPTVAAAALIAWALLGTGLLTGRDLWPDLSARWVTLAALAFGIGLVAYWLVRLAAGTVP